MIFGFDETRGTLEEILESARLCREAESILDPVDDAARLAEMEALLLEYPVCEYAFGKPEDIPFSDKVLTICQTDCLRYGKSWACPPNAGDIQDNIKKTLSYRHFLMFSTMNEVADSGMLDQCLEAKKSHEELTRSFRETLQQVWKGRFYVLSSGCSICDDCNCPNEACRHPEDRLMTTESHGMVFLQLIEQLGMEIFCGGNIIPYYSMILFD